MNTLSYKGLFARVEFDAEDGIFVGRLTGINDIVGFHADSVADLVRSFREAVDDYLVACERVGKTAGKPYSGKLMLRVDPTVHAMAALAAELTGKSMNQWSEEALRASARAVIPE